jgi:DNA-binding GntR family transcriptional regulator
MRRLSLVNAPRPENPPDFPDSSDTAEETLAGDSPIARSVLADQVKDRLLQGILSGRFPAGSRIVETRIAREIGTSQAPVREALRGLEALGLVEITPFRGARVRRPSSVELLEAYAVRSELESLAARLAVPRLTDKDFARLTRWWDEMRRAAAAGDAHATAIADASFHSTLIHLTGNATLERVWNALEPFSRTYITVAVPGADPQWTADLHVPIMAALRERNPEQVASALREHFALASARLAREWDGAAVRAASSAQPAAASSSASAAASSS